ncbi:MAG: hypothetical protein JWN72_1037, partial [Thermoleophilia bacterium]|nr:hypothetical protein [Thermoleophilia bacterium]
ATIGTPTGLQTNPQISQVAGTDTLWMTSASTGRLLRSVDRGQSWTTITSPSPTGFTAVAGSSATSAIAITTRTNGTVSRTGYAYVTTDAGATWNPVVVDTIPITTIAATTGSLGLIDRSTTSGRIVVVGNWALGNQFREYYSDDGGSTWTAQSKPFTDRMRYITGSTWMGSNRMNQVLVSSDDGVTWVTRSTTGDYRLFFNDVTTERGAGHVVVVGEGASVYRTTNLGTTWTSAAPQMPSYAAVVAFDAQHLAVVGSDGSAVRSDDGGATVQAATGCGGSGFLQGVATSPTSGLVVGGGGRICRTLDGGASWQVMPSGTSATFVGIVRARTTGHLIAYGTTSTSLFTSDDDGATWQPMTVSFGGTVAHLAIDADASTIAVSRNSNGLLWVSSDAGATWTSSDDGVSSTIYGLAVAPSGNRILVGHYALASDNLNRLARSDDGGVTWSSATATNDGSQPTVIEFATERRVWMVASRDALLSDDGGATFTSRATTAAAGQVLQLVPTDANTAVVAGTGRLLATSAPATSVPDVSGGTGLTSPAGAFGGCLQSVSGAAAAWPVAGTCAAGTPAPWRAIVPTAGDVGSTVATIPGGAATVDVVFGLRVGSTQRSGAYVADITVAVLAP